MLILGSSLFNSSRTFMTAVLILYLQNHGIDLYTISLAKSLQLAASILITVPAGKFADKFGKKVSVVLACFLAIFYNILLLRPSAILLIVAEIMNGLSIAFYSGAYESWLFDQKCKHKQESTYHLYAKSQEYAFIAIMIAGLCGATFNSIALYMSITMLLVTAYIFLICEETVNKKPIYLEAIKNTPRITKEIIFLSLPVILFGSFIQIIYQLWPAFMIQPFINVSQKQLGIIFVFIMLGQFFLSKVSKLIKKLPTKRNYLVGTCFLFLFFTLLMPSLLRSTSSLNIILLALFLVFTISFCAITYNIFFTLACDAFDKNSKSTSISYLDAMIRGVAASVLFAGYISQTKNVLFYGFVFLFLFGVVFFIQKMGFQRKYYA